MVGGVEESDLGDYKIYGIYLCKLPERLHLPEEAFGNEVSSPMFVRVGFGRLNVELKRPEYTNQIALLREKADTIVTIV